MKKIILTAILASGIASASLAGSVQILPPAEPVVAGSTAPDWSGFYAGINVGSTGGTTSFSDTPSVFDLNDATTYGAFAGYNIQSGSLVYGAELAYSQGFSQISIAPSYVGFDDYLDIKGRVGYAMGSMLLYGVLGGNYSSYTDSPVVSGNGFGLMYGAGVDYLVSSNYFVGLEYLVRNPIIGLPSFDAEPDLHTVQIRAGMKF